MLRKWTEYLHSLTDSYAKILAPVGWHLEGEIFQILAGFAQFLKYFMRRELCPFHQMAPNVEGIIHIYG